MTISIGLFLLLLLFVFGAIVGSFLNVVILRHNTGKSLSGRSGCAVCGDGLGVMELIPVISYIVQGGKCKKCKSRISKQYVLVEFATGTLFALVGTFSYAHQLTYLVTILMFLAMSILVILATYDIKHTILPDKYVYSFITLSIIIVFLMQPNMYILGWQLIGGITTALPIFALWFFSRGRAMGFGDVKLSVGLGIFLGIYMGISAIWYAFMLGAVYGSVLLFLKRAHGKSEIAFGPFLIFGFLIALFTNVGFIEFVNGIISV